MPSSVCPSQAGGSGSVEPEAAERHGREDDAVGADLRGAAEVRDVVGRRVGDRGGDADVVGTVGDRDVERVADGAGVAPGVRRVLLRCRVVRPASAVLRRAGVVGRLRHRLAVARRAARGAVDRDGDHHVLVLPGVVAAVVVVDVEPADERRHAGPARRELAGGPGLWHVAEHDRGQQGQDGQPERTPAPVGSDHRLPLPSRARNRCALGRHHTKRREGGQCGRSRYARWNRPWNRLHRRAPGDRVGPFHLGSERSRRKGLEGAAGLAQASDRRPGGRRAAAVRRSAGARRPGRPRGSPRSSRGTAPSAPTGRR